MPSPNIRSWRQEIGRNFRYDASKLEAFEAEFLQQSGRVREVQLPWTELEPAIVGDSDLTPPPIEKNAR